MRDKEPPRSLRALPPEGAQSASDGPAPTGVQDLVARTLADAMGRVQAADPLVLLEHAGVRFGDVQALHGVSLALRRGDRLALVGANGSGKTTLLRLLHGLVPFEGRRDVVAIDGRVPVIAMLFQRPFLLSLSVRWNVLLGLWLNGVPRAQRDERCQRALQRVGLDALAGRSARSLSGGQQQRLALARAWALEPDILLLDEPTANLDPSAKREVERLIGALADDGVTVVMSTHNLGQAKRLATRVAYLEAGRLVVDLAVDRFFNDVLPAEAALFLKGELPWA
jgi:tungstate transport system ATP-binding protein